MAESLLSVGLDVGTTSTQLVVSRLTIANQASAFSVPRMDIADREVLYRSAVYFTPLLGQDRVDGAKIREIVEAEYRKAGITKDMVDTGAVIITGETSRKENARAVLDALAELAGDFVAATAGPDLESVLAAKGSGAVDFSKETGKPVLHMDIGGGTSNFAWIKAGKVVATGCMNVGGRLVKLSQTGVVTYVSPVLDGLTALKVGDYPAPGQLEGIARLLVHGLEMAAGLRPETELLHKLWTKECARADGPMEDAVATFGRTPSVISTDQREWRNPLGNTDSSATLGMTRGNADSSATLGMTRGKADSSATLGMTGEDWVLSFSGGVAECIDTVHRPGEFGDMGVELGQAIKHSLLCRGQYRVGENAIRATVIGAGCHSAQLSGSTVFCRDVSLPLKNLPVAEITEEEQEDPALSALIRQRMRQLDGAVVALAIPGFSGGYDRLTALAQRIAEAFTDGPVIVCLEADMAKALGQKLGLLLPNTPVLCIDRVQLRAGSYLDVGQFAGPALPVVVKTLVWEK